MQDADLDVLAGSVPPSLELLSYYRQRIEDFETERAEFLKKFKDLEVCAGCCVLTQPHVTAPMPSVARHTRCPMLAARSCAGHP